MKTISIAVCLLATTSALFADECDALVGTPTEVQPVTPEYVNRLAAWVRTNHPSLLAVAARARAAGAAAGAVRIWDDPMLRVGTQVAEEAMRADEGDLIYGIEQKLPLFGKEKAMRQMAASEAQVSLAEATNRFQLLRRDLAQALFRAALAERTVDIGEQDRHWLETLASATEAKYGSGTASFTELSLVQNEFARRTNQLHTDLALRDNTHVGLNRMVNRDFAAPWPRLALPPVAGSVKTDSRLLDLAVRFSAELAVSRTMTNAAVAAVQSARRQRYPDVSVDLEGRNYTGNGDFRQGMFLLGFTFPLGNAAKYRRTIEQEQARLEAARHDLANDEARVREEITRLAVAIDAARREAVLYRDEIIPRSERALASAQADWEAGRGSFRDLLDARRMLLEGQQMFARAVAEQYVMLSDLVLCCGLGDLEALGMVGAGVPETGAK